jgi:hypothetical protein
MTAVAASSTAMTAVAASSTAMTAINANDQAVRILMLAGTGLSYSNYANAAAIAANTTAMTAIAASAQAMSNVAVSSAATTAIKDNATANNTALGSSYSVGAYIDRIRIIGGASTDATLAAQATMTAVAANSTAMNAVVASAAAKMAMFGSDTALNAIAASATAITAIRAAAGYSVLATAGSTGSRAWPGVAGGKYIIAGVSTNDASTGATITVSTLRAGSARPNTHLTDASSVSLATALGAILCPCGEAFTVTTTDGTAQIIYLGALRCDV